jgi:glutamate/tyrosine decarboxylase-like PLP-dependent enzyme
MRQQANTTQTCKALFPPAADRRRLGALLDAALDGLGERIARGPVTPALDMAAFRRELAAYDFATPYGLEAVLPWVMAQLEHGIVQITHPRYFGLFNPAPSFPAQCADRIAGAFNPQLASATTSPVPVEMEAHVIRAVAARAGLPADAAGHFTSGGSEANCTAVIAALTAAHPGFAREGVRCFAGRPVFYVSRESHLAWIKIAHQAGIGRDAVRLVATDGGGRMSMAHLRAAIAADRAHGCVPFLIVATVGTTGGGMVDPLAACAAFAADQGIWFHADAAWGGAVIASPRHAAVLAGMERADSITIDAHKWLATTMGCGMFITRRADVLSAAFQVANDFMPPSAASGDPYVVSMQWSRRFLGLRLFLALATAGWDGYAAHVERAIALATQLGIAMTARGWTVVNDPALAVVCLVPPAGAPADIVRHVLASGRAWVSTASFEGRAVVRACVTHGLTGEPDLAVLVEALEEAEGSLLF